MKHFRIKDIAVMAGVSVGTVDRVLHKRGRVSEEAQKKVEKALKEINYQPNLIARSLASKKVCRILTIIPSYQPGDYWSIVYEGIAKAEQEFSDYHLEVKPLYFNQYDKSSFDLLIPEIQKETCQGVIIAPLFKESSLKLTQYLDEQSIPYILIDAFIENTKSLAYYGTDSYTSGYLSGRLLFKQIQADNNLLLFNIIRKGSTESPQVSMREKGFRDYLSEAGFQGSIYPISISAEYPEDNTYILNTFLKKRNNIKAGIIFNSRVHIAASYFLKHKITDFFMIGYDTIDANIPYLKNGIVSHLIAQRPEVQGYNSVKALFYHLSLNQAVEKINYMPIDILMKENIDYYNNYI
ncbi:MAG: substrate-binding domain-containing protein [Tannerella sp.]|jgi:LacI family transcriptional regulator|nr:substrate-binding domain-containing protein [Tannerella sp.]